MQSIKQWRNGGHRWYFSKNILVLKHFKSTSDKKPTEAYNSSYGKGMWFMKGGEGMEKNQIFFFFLFGPYNFLKMKRFFSVSLLMLILFYFFLIFTAK